MLLAQASFFIAIIWKGLSALRNSLLSILFDDY